MHTVTMENVPFGGPDTEEVLAEEVKKVLGSTHHLFGISEEEIADKCKYPHGVWHGRCKVTISVEITQPCD